MNDTSASGDTPHTAKIGRLEEVNGHRQLTGTLWEANRTQWTCHFSPEHASSLSGAWMHTVKLTGRPLVTDGEEHALQVETITILDPESETNLEQSEGEDFWNTLSLEELAAQQGIVAVDDLDAISALWPVDDDPDELLHYLLQERRERRKLHESREEAE
jgi:hypothetical protein